MNKPMTSVGIAILTLICVPQLNAGIVVTSSISYADSSTFTDVTITIKGASNAVSDAVSTWALSATVSPFSGTVSKQKLTIPTDPTSGEWNDNDFTRVDTFTGLVAQLKGSVPTLNNVTISSTASTIATLEFRVNKTSSVQNFTISLNPEDALFPSGYPANDGFFSVDGTGSVFTKLGDNIPFSIGGGSIGALSAVPEPSSLLLCGIALSTLMTRRRQRVAIIA